jgi:integrase
MHSDASCRGAPFTVSGLQKLVERAGNIAKIGFKVHPRMLRHATGFVLANRGTDTRTLQAYLGHRSIQSTVRYTELAPSRFKNLWRTQPLLTRQSRHRAAFRALQPHYGSPASTGDTAPRAELH